MGSYVLTVPWIILQLPLGIRTCNQGRHRRQSLTCHTLMKIAVTNGIKLLLLMLMIMFHCSHVHNVIYLPYVLIFLEPNHQIYGTHLNIARHVALESQASSLWLEWLGALQQEMPWACRHTSFLRIVVWFCLTFTHPTAPVKAESCLRLFPTNHPPEKEEGKGGQ